MFIKKFFSMQWYAPVWIEIVFVYQVSNKIVPNLAKCLVLVMFLSKPINKQRDPKTAIVTLKRPTGFNQDFVMLADFFHLLRFWSNVWFAKKDTKRSSVLLLCLVYFFANQTLCMCKWENSALVETLVQSHYHDFYVTRFFSRTKTREMRRIVV